MNTDRELLVLAARAAGMKLVYAPDDGPCRGCQFIDGKSAAWNPLTDDGDRYRLMHLLQISVDFNDACAWHRSRNGLIQEFWGGDCMDEAHAIVSVAAELGRNMP
jgi:hypothetical protein